MRTWERSFLSQLRKVRDKVSPLFVVLGAVTPKTAPAIHLRVANPEDPSQPEQGCKLHAQMLGLSRIMFPFSGALM